MKSILSALVIFNFAIALWASSAAGYFFVGTECSILDSMAGLVNRTDIRACQGLLLPSGVGVATFGPANDLVEIRLTIYACDFNLRPGFAPRVTDYTMVAHAGLALNNSQYFDLGSSAASIRLAATVQSHSAFHLFYGPGIQVTELTNSSFGSRFNFLPRGGPNLSINATQLETLAVPSELNVTFVEFFNTVISGPQSVTYNIETASVGNTTGTTACFNTIDGIEFTSSCVDMQGDSLFFRVAQQDTPPLYLAQC